MQPPNSCCPAKHFNWIWCYISMLFTSPSLTNNIKMKTNIQQLECHPLNAIFFSLLKKGLKLIAIMVITHHHNSKMFLVEWIKLWITFAMSCFCQVMLSGTCLCVFAEMKWKLDFKNTYSFLSFILLIFPLAHASS